MFVRYNLISICSHCGRATVLHFSRCRSVTIPIFPPSDFPYYVPIETNRWRAECPAFAVANCFTLVTFYPLLEHRITLIVLQHLQLKLHNILLWRTREK